MQVLKESTTKKILLFLMHVSIIAVNFQISNLFFDPEIERTKLTYTHTYIWVYMYMYLYMCVCNIGYNIYLYTYKSFFHQLVLTQLVNHC